MFAMPIVRAPARFASRKHESVNGVVPLAATAISTVIRADAVAADKGCGLNGLIFSAFDGAGHGLFAARDEKQQPVARPAEGGHQLRAILHRKTAGSSGAGVDEPAAGPQPGFHGKSCVDKRGPGRTNRGDGGKLPLDHRIECVERLPQVDVSVARAWPFRIHWFRKGGRTAWNLLNSILNRHRNRSF